MCFFTFHWVFRKDCLKEKSDVSFMASPPGKTCYRQAPPLSPRIWNVRYRFLQQLKCNDSSTSVSQSLTGNDKMQKWNQEQHQTIGCIHLAVVLLCVCEENMAIKRKFFFLLPPVFIQDGFMSVKGPKVVLVTFFGGGNQEECATELNSCHVKPSCGDVSDEHKIVSKHFIKLVSSIWTTSTEGPAVPDSRKCLLHIKPPHPNRKSPVASSDLDLG